MGEEEAPSSSNHEIFRLNFPLEHCKLSVLAVIKVIKVDDEEDCPAYVDAELFVEDEHGELQTEGTLDTDPGTPLDGRYEFEHDGEEYVAIIAESEEEEEEVPPGPLTYRKLRDMLNGLSEEHPDDNPSILVVDGYGGEVREFGDFVDKWPEEGTDDYGSMYVEEVDGVLDDGHPYFTLFLT